MHPDEQRVVDNPMPSQKVRVLHDLPLQPLSEMVRQRDRPVQFRKVQVLMHQTRRPSLLLPDSALVCRSFEVETLVHFQRRVEDVRHDD